MNMIDRVYRLKHKMVLNIPGYNGTLNFINGQTFHIVGGVLYMEGVPIPPMLQEYLISWIKENPNLFVEDNRKF